MIELGRINRYQDLSRFSVPTGFRGRPAWVVLLWQLVQGTVFAWSPQPAYAWRRNLLRLFGAQVGSGVLVRPTARITYPWKIVLADHAWIGDHTELYSLGSIEIGEHAVISQKCYLCAGTHDYRSIDFPLRTGPIRIEAEAWVATDCFIGPGVTIGLGAIVAACSTVLNDVPGGRIVAGSPAQVKGMRPAAGRPAQV